MPPSHLHFELCLSRKDSTGEAANRGDDAEWQWCSRYCTSIAGKSFNRHSGIKKKQAQLESVNQPLLRQLQAEQFEVDIVRVEEDKEIEGSGIEESEPDEMWSVCRQ